MNEKLHFRLSYWHNSNRFNRSLSNSCSWLGPTMYWTFFINLRLRSTHLQKIKPLLCPVVYDDWQMIEINCCILSFSKKTWKHQFNIKCQDWLMPQLMQSEKLGKVSTSATYKLPLNFMIILNISGSLFQLKLNLLSTVLFNGFQNSPLSEAVPCKLYGSGEQSESNFLQDQANFAGLRHDKLPLFLTQLDVNVKFCKVLQPVFFNLPVTYVYFNKLHVFKTWILLSYSFM